MFSLQFVDQKRPLVSRLFDGFARWLARAVPGFGLDPDQHRIGTGVGRLQGCSEFEAMRRHHPIIVVSRCDQSSRVVRAGLEIVVWGVGMERLEFRRVFRRAIIGDPRPACGKFIEPEHVHHPDRRQRGRE